MKNNDTLIIVGSIFVIVVCVVIAVLEVKAVWSTDLPWFIKLRLLRGAG